MSDGLEKALSDGISGNSRLCIARLQGVIWRKKWNCVKRKCFVTSEYVPTDYGTNTEGVYDELFTLIRKGKSLNTVMVTGDFIVQLRKLNASEAYVRWVMPLVRSAYR